MIYAFFPHSSFRVPLPCGVHASVVLRRAGINVAKFSDDETAYNFNYAINDLQPIASDLKTWLYEWRITK
jgi:hypothetical protein